MLAAVSTDSTKEFLCKRCWRSLGRYEVYTNAGGISPWTKSAATFIRPVLLPKGMVIGTLTQGPLEAVRWDGTGRTPTQYFRSEPGGWKRIQGSLTKYRWRCLCGAGPCYRSERLATLLSGAGPTAL